MLDSVQPDAQCEARNRMARTNREALRERVEAGQVIGAHSDAQHCRKPLVLVLRRLGHLFHCRRSFRSRRVLSLAVLAPPGSAVAASGPRCGPGRPGRGAHEWAARRHALECLSRCVSSLKRPTASESICWRPCARLRLPPCLCSERARRTSRRRRLVRRSPGLLPLWSHCPSSRPRTQDALRPPRWRMAVRPSFVLGATYGRSARPLARQVLDFRGVQLHSLRRTKHLLSDGRLVLACGG